MWPDRVSNPGPLTYESGALPTALRNPACPAESHSQILPFSETGNYLTSNLPKKHLTVS